MTVINSFIHESAGEVVPALGRSTSGFEYKYVHGTGSSSLSASFSVMPLDTVYSGRVVVLIIGCYFDGNGTISTVQYGSQSFTRAVGTSSTSDKGSCEIWYGVVPTNPASNVVTVNANVDIEKLFVSREILVGLTSSSPYDTEIDKEGSEFEVAISFYHPTNGISLLGCIIWKDGITNVNATWTNCTETADSDASLFTGGEAEFASAYYTSAISSSPRTFTVEWSGILDPNVELTGASWR